MEIQFQKKTGNPKYSFKSVYEKNTYW